MKHAYMITLFCALGCSQTDSSTPTESSETQSRASITLNNLVYFDMYGEDYNTQHPLVCGTGREFPAGREMVFRYNESSESVHAVFPEEATAPKNLNGKFVLHGHYQGIQNRDYYKHKKPPSDYRYFVVASWECRK